MRPNRTDYKTRSCDPTLRHNRARSGLTTTKNRSAATRAAIQVLGDNLGAVAIHMLCGNPGASRPTCYGNPGAREQEEVVQRDAADVIHVRQFTVARSREKRRRDADQTEQQVRDGQGGEADDRRPLGGGPAPPRPRRVPAVGQGRSAGPQRPGRGPGGRPLRWRRGPDGEASKDDQVDPRQFHHQTDIAVISQYQAKRLTGKNVSVMTKFVSNGS